MDWIQLAQDDSQEAGFVEMGCSFYTSDTTQRPYDKEKFGLVVCEGAERHVRRPVCSVEEMRTNVRIAGNVSHADGAVEDVTSIRTLRYA